MPLGFDLNVAHEDIGVHGGAAQDANFIGGNDKVSYVVNLESGDDMPYMVKVEILHQSIGYQWGQNLESYSAPELERFLEYYQSVPNSPVLVGKDEVVIREKP